MRARTPAIADEPGQQKEVLDVQKGPMKTLEMSNTPEIEPYLDARDAADFLRRSPKTIQTWARSGMIPAHPIGAGKKRYWLFRKSELDKWILAQV